MSRSKFEIIISRDILKRPLPAGVNFYYNILAQVK